MKFRRLGEVIVQQIFEECANEYDDHPELQKIFPSDDHHNILYYGCIESKTSLETAKYSRDYWSWVSKKRYPPSK